MVGFREVREALLLAHNNNFINDEELLLLYDLFRSKNLDLPYWRYNMFDLDRLDDSECLANFQFNKGDIYNLKEKLQIPEDVFCYNRTRVDGVEVFCVFLNRLAYPISTCC